MKSIFGSKYCNCIDSSIEEFDRLAKSSGDRKSLINMFQQQLMRVATDAYDILQNRIVMYTPGPGQFFLLLVFVLKILLCVYRQNLQ